MKKLKQTLAWLLVLCMVTSFLPASVFAAAATAPTTNLSTTGSPFQKGTGESNSFRIPALVTLSDGTLVAAADARWNTTYDGGGLDTMVAISKDNGATWTHSFANYLGDNGNQYNGASSCFIDPSLAVHTDEDGNDTIYMLCDLYPNGVALNGAKETTPVYSTGFDANGNLKLTTVAPGTYADNDFTHYLNGEQIYAYNGTPVEGLTVDAWFNVTGTYDGEEVDSNLFFADSPFHVARTGYLYLTKSTNGGETWSAPQLLNLKTSDEMVCLVGPNGGMVTSNGVIVFPVYSYTGSAEYTGLIYSEDNGATWQRSASLTAIDSSEADAVELDNGNLRVFFRNESTCLCYADFDLTTGTWIAQANGFTYVNTQVPCNSNTELSAITYSQGVTHEGKEKSVILVSCPASANLAGSSSIDGSWRTSGRIFAGLVDPETFEMTWLDNSVAVTPVATSQLSGFPYSAEKGFFGYSSMTEQLENGSVTILYEDNQYGWNTGDNYYYTIASKTYTQSDLEKALGITFGGNTDVDVDGSEGESYEKDVTVKLGETFTETVEGIYVPNGSTENDYVSVSWTGTQGTSTTTTVTITPKKVGETTVELGNGAISYNVAVNSTASNIVDVQMKVNETKNFTISGSNFEDSIVQEPAEAIADMTVTGTSAVRELREITSLDQFVSGKSYFITSRNGQHVLTDEAYSNSALKIGGVVSVDSTELWTFTATDTSEYFTIARNGKYLNIADGSITMSTNAQNLRVYRFYASSNGETHWVIADGKGNALNNFSQNNVQAGEWSPDAGGQWRIYEIAETPASTTVSFTGKAVGRTTAVVGETTYNITVLPENAANTVDIEVKVGETYTHTDTTGNHKDNVSLQPNADIATMTVTGTDAVTGTKSLKEITSTDALVSGKQYLIANTRPGTLLTDESYTSGNASWLGTLTGLKMEGTPSVDSKELWTITAVENGYTLSQNGKYLTIGNKSAAMSDTAETFTLTYSETNNWFIKDSTGYYLSDLAGNTLEGAFGFNDSNRDGDHWKIYEIVDTSVSASTEITFTGVAPGTTTAVVGNTLYNITVTGEIVDIELEIGESFTYTDTTGNYVDKVTEQPNGTYATMTVAGTSNSTVKKLVKVTASTFQTGKRYVIENVRAADPDHDAYQPDHSVLTSTALTYVATGLDMNGPLDANSSQTWTFTPNDNMYYVSRDNSFITLDGSNAYMSTAAQSLSFEYVNDEGWLIYYNADGNNTSNDGDYFLSDVEGKGRGEAFGITTKDDDGNYWNIYEVVEEQHIDSTKVTFTGVAEGKTTAIVSNTQYNITVVPAEVDDEVMNSATDTWTVDPEIQRNRYNTIINGKYKDLYTDESWKQYEAARQAAYKKLVEVTNAKYDSKEKADTALAELKTLVDALETAANQLVAATTISVRYRLDTADGTLLDTREYKIASTDTSVTLPDTIVVGDIAYKVTDTTLERQGAETSYNVPVTLIGKVGEGFVGSEDIKPGELTYNDHSTVCDLVDNNGGKKITEMTVTVGISYNLDLGIEMLDGYTVEWLSDNTSVATVDQEGNVTAVGEGIANITATVKDAAGNIVEVNSIPVNVYPKGTGDRTVAVYIENIENTTVWCVINANTNAYGFEVIEGELVYGQFDTTVSDGTKTTAMSFFGDPDEAHALVYMKSTNSDDHYFQLHDKDGNMGEGVAGYLDGKAEYYYISNASTGAGYWQALGLNDNTNPNWNKIKDMVQWAINLGCDGGLGFTRRQDGGALGSNLSFKSDPMPRIEKVVDGVLPTTRKQANYRRYVDDMVAAVHELVYFKITVTQEVPTEWKDADQTVGAIVYSDAWVKDTVLPGAYLYTKEKDQADGTWDGEISEAFRTQKEDITGKLNEAWTAEQKEAGKRVFDFYLLYEIQESDIPKFFIDNIANLDYNYESHYSTGAQAAAADAEARISVVGSAIDNVVIDFGQSFTYEGHEFESYTDGKTYTFTGLTNVHLKGAFVDGEYDAAGNFTEVPGGSGAAAKYGDVKVYRTDTGKEDDKGYPEYIYTVEYTPTAILHEADAVRIYGIGENNQEKMINGFLVYPATTVYYEEGFLEDVNGWNFSTAKKATTEQTFELLGVSQFDNHGTLTHYISNKKQAYGFDPIYDGISDNGEVANSYISSNTAGDVAKFTFTGTGFEIFADCTENSGYVTVTVTDKNGNNVKMFTVNTVVKGGDTGATTGQTGNMDALPIVSLKDLEHGTYTVTLTKVVNDGKTVTIDGIRITNTVSDSSIYNVDLEDSPEFYQLRDAVMNAIGIFPETSKDYIDSSMLEGKTNEEIEELLRSVVGVIDLDETANQVYNSMFSNSDSEAPTAVITDISVIYGKNAEIQDLLDNGPKNEIYLWPNQTLTFKVATQRVIQVGMKAPSGATGFGCTIRDDLTDTLAYVGGGVYGATDMFYYLTNKPVESINNTYVVSITNMGEKVLAITDLKVCDDPSASFVPLTLEDVTEILRDAGYTDNSEPEAPLPFEDVPADAFYYEPVAWAVKNGITNGISDTRFAPDNLTTRGQIVTFLWRAAGKPEPASTTNPFADVDESEFYYKAILWAVETGITNGVTKTTFNPDGNCTRAQAVTFLYRYAGKPTVEGLENPFEDISSKEFYYNAILWAVKNGITTGVTTTTFVPDATCTRGQIVSFLYRHMAD